MFRIHQFLASESIATAGTKTIDINVVNPISSIVIEVKGTNNGSVPTAHPAKMITKIELVDGSDVLASVSGIEAQAANILDGRSIAYPEQNYQNNVMAIAVMSINFGRWLNDLMYAFDPKRFTNPQLRITHNKALGGSVPDAGELSVFAHIMDVQSSSPIGFFSLREVFTYSLTSSAAEFIDLPVDRKIRKLIVQSLAAGKQPHEQYNKLKLSIDGDRRVLLNELSTSSLIKFLEGNPYFSESVRCIDVDAETTLFITPTYAAVVQGEGLNASEVTFFHDESYGGTVDVTAGAAGAIDLVVQGKGPHGALSVPMGVPSDPATWLDVANINDLDLKITAGSAVGSSSTAEVVLETERLY